MLRKIVFLKQFGIASLLTSGRRSLFAFGGLAANNSSGGLHGTYVKQTKALSIFQFCYKHNGKVLEALILKQVIQFQAMVLNMVFLWTKGLEQGVDTGSEPSTCAVPTNF